MKPREYRVAASCFEPEPAHSIEKRRNALRAHLEQLVTVERPDLVVLPEMALVIGVGEADRWGAESLRGPTVSMAAEAAARHKVNVCLPIIEDADGMWYNTAVYLDRGGKLAGVYRKQVPTPAECRGGIRPGGPAQAVVCLDGLRLGTAICFDANFPDQIWHWIDAGVDLLVFPSYTYAGEMVRNWALNCGVPLVCAFPWESVIYERDGRALVRAGTETSTVRLGHHWPWIVGTLNFRRRIYHLDDNQVRLKELSARYGPKVEVSLIVPDGRFMLAARGDDVDLDAVEREFNLVPLQEYLRASRKLAREARAFIS